MASKSKPTRKDEKKNSNMNKIISGSVFGVVLFFAFLMLFSLFSLKKSLDSSVYLPASLAAGGVSGLISGFIIVKFIKENGVLYGGITGTIQAIIDSLIIFIFNKGSAGIGLLILIIIVAFCGALGGIGAVNIKKKIKY